jgi:hypothetical protein
MDIDRGIGGIELELGYGRMVGIGGRIEGNRAFR